MQVRTLSVALAICAVLGGGVAFAGATPEFVYLSNEDRILRLDPATCINDPSCIQTVLDVSGAEFEGLNFGPDERLYWCDRENGRVGRVDPGTSVNEVIFDAGIDPGPTSPQCGWFSHRGDFFVTDAGKVWAFPELAGSGPPYPTPVQVLGGEDVGDAPLDGVIQYVDGDLLLVRAGATGAILRSEFPGFLPDQGPATTTTLIPGVADPSGIAVSHGYLFATSGSNILRFGSEGDPKEPCASVIGNPSQIHATVSGQLYVGTSGKTGLLFRVPFDAEDGCGTPQLIASLRPRDGFRKVVGGVAATPATALVTAGPFAGSHTYLLNGENTWELTAGDPCTATLGFTPTSPATVQAAIDTVVDLNDTGDPVSATPVAALGGNGFAGVWDIDATACPPAEDDVYRHLVSLQAPFLSNPRLVRCGGGVEPPEGCEVVTLTSYIPFDPDLAPLDPLGSKVCCTSEHFLMEVEVDGPAATFCGFESPLTDTEDGEPPAVLSIGDTVPVKFRLAVGEEGDCQNGPFLAQGASALLSVARTAPFEVLEVLSDGTGEVDPAIFSDPGGPNQFFHYNLNTSGFTPGPHVLTVTFLTDNDAVRMTEVIFE